LRGFSPAQRDLRGRYALIAAMALLIALNLATLAQAYPESLAVDPGCCATRPLAKDFSAYYTAAWRLVHDPSQVYSPGYLNDGEFQILPQPESFKYLPSFLLVILPLLALPYGEALLCFDAAQFLLLPLMAFVLYRLTARRSLAVAGALAVLVLLQPSPLPPADISVTYYWQWAEGQAKVIQTALLLGAFFLGSSGRSRMSGALFGLSAFDPRFALMAIPLFAAYNRGRIRSAFALLGITMVSTNLLLLYPGVGSGFIRMLATSGVDTPIYPYAFIPLLTVLSLTLLNARRIAITLSSKGPESYLENA
jgi:Glycosyltransferase family 87